MPQWESLYGLGTNPLKWFSFTWNTYKWFRYKWFSPAPNNSALFMTSQLRRKIRRSEIARRFPMGLEHVCFTIYRVTWITHDQAQIMSSSSSGPRTTSPVHLLADFSSGSTTFHSRIPWKVLLPPHSEKSEIGHNSRLVLGDMKVSRVAPC